MVLPRILPDIGPPPQNKTRANDVDTDNILQAQKPWLVNTIFICVISIATFKILPIMLSVMLGVSLLLLTQCITITQLKESFDLKIFLTIVSAHMLSLALQNTAGLSHMADLIRHISQNISPLIVLFLSL